MRDVRANAWWNKHRYSAIVFLTGAAILIVEVTATRILSPYYGNTIYTVSSVISVILGALSVGYWRGGIRADAKPEIGEFFRIIFQSGVSLVLLFGLVTLILPVGGNYFSLQLGPLVWSIILFFPSSYLMGMLSPFAITLAHKDAPHKGLGHTTGEIFFWSTAGSIVGSLGAGFLLIPYVGVHSILFLTTLAILLLGGVGEWKAGARAARRGLIINLIFCLTILIFLFAATRFAPDNEFLFQKDGIYERITIRDTHYAGKPARFFLQDRSSSGAIFLESDELAFPYTKYFDLYKFATTTPRRALFIGGGVYSMPKALHEEVPRTMIDVVDIEPSLESVAKKYFRLPDTPQIITHTADGRRFLFDAPERYDLIFSDVYYSLYSIPSHFTTREFFALAKSRLAPNGIFLANIIGSRALTDDSLLLSEIHTMREVFPDLHVFAVDSPSSGVVQNFILMGTTHASATPLSLAKLPLTENAQERRLIEGFLLHEVPLDSLPYKDYTIMTDDFAPVEHLVGSLITMPPEESETQAARLPKTHFDGTTALSLIERIVLLGSRAIGTPGHEKLRTLIHEHLTGLADSVSEQTWTMKDGSGRPLVLTNVIARFTPENPRRIIVGTHYDSIVRAYRDTKNPNAYMPGANNSASGVATLLELAQTLKGAPAPVGIDLVFFDGEEGITALGAGDKNWLPLGSTYFAGHLTSLYPTTLPDTGIILDMVCDRDLKLQPEKFSLEYASNRINSFWNIGSAIAPDAFGKTAITSGIGDDHLPLNASGIPSFLVIDFDYEPWFNTTRDTPDKCSAESLQTVGTTLEAYLRTRS